MSTEVLNGHNAVNGVTLPGLGAAFQPSLAETGATQQPSTQPSPQGAVQTEPPADEDGEEVHDAKTGRIVSGQILRDEHGRPRLGKNGGVLVGAICELNLDKPLTFERVDKDKTGKETRRPLKQTTYSSGVTGLDAADDNGLELKITVRAYVDNPKQAAKTIARIR